MKDGISLDVLGEINYMGILIFWFDIDILNDDIFVKFYK